MGAHVLNFEIDGLSCAACVGRAEKAMNSVAGIDQAQVNLATKSARVMLNDVADDPARLLTGALQAAGYPAVSRRDQLAIDGMSCASCSAKVEAALNALPQVLTAQVNLATEQATITHLDRDPATLIDQIRQLGYDAHPVSSETNDNGKADREIKSLRNATLISAALTLPVFAIEMGGHAVPAIHHWIHATFGLQDSWLLQFILTTLVLIGPGRGFFVKGIPALIRRAPDMNSLVVLGAMAAWTYSTIAVFRPDWLPDGSIAVYFEAAAVIVTLILLGRWLEARAKGRTGDAIRRLVGLRPKTAQIERGDAVVTVPIEDIQRGDILQIRPGEQIAVDGIVRDGQSWVDESMITGEPVPAEKSKGDTLMGGTINGAGILRMRAQAVGSDTVLARIIAMVQEAQGARLPVQDLVNRITLWFVPAVLGVALATILIWLVFGPAPALPLALVAGVSVLIIACPCAMGLATPTSIMVGTGRAAELGVLFRQGDALQSLQSVDIVAFDKTGTLTMGRPEVTEITALDRPEDTFLAIVAAAEALSEHPLAQAIVTATKARNLALPEVRDVRVQPGLGLSAMVAGDHVLIGNLPYLQAQRVDVTPLIAMRDTYSARGFSPVLVAINGVAAGALGLSDQAKPTAQATIDALHASGLQVAMISGDVQAAADVLGHTLGIDRIIANVRPEGKVAAIRDLQAAGLRVAFVGDGINDAPALAQAEVGLAIGSGTDVAIEAADVVLMSGDPAGVVTALRISKRTMANIKQNLGWAFGYNILLIPVAAGVLYPIWGTLLSPALAAGAMALSSVLVVSNALRLRYVGRGA